MGSGRPTPLENYPRTRNRAETYAACAKQTLLQGTCPCPEGPSLSPAVG
jgi:hypothetical protein